MFWILGPPFDRVSSMRESREVGEPKELPKFIELLLSIVGNYINLSSDLLGILMKADKRFDLRHIVIPLSLLEYKSSLQAMAAGMILEILIKGSRNLRRS